MTDRCLFTKMEKKIKSENFYSFELQIKRPREHILLRILFHDMNQERERGNIQRYLFLTLPSNSFSKYNTLFVIIELYEAFIHSFVFKLFSCNL